MQDEERQNYRQSIRYGSAGGRQRSLALPRRAGRVLCSSLELLRALLPNALPSCTITLALSNKTSGKKSSSFSELSLLERPPRSMLLLETMLISMVCAAV